jgi:hypothetical protein
MKHNERPNLSSAEPTDRRNLLEHLAATTMTLGDGARDPHRAERMNVQDLDRRAERCDAELYIRDGRAWVIVVGAVNPARAIEVFNLVDELASQPSLRRVSVDLTCTTIADHGTAGIINALRDGAAPWVDVTTAAAIGRLHVERHAA